MGGAARALPESSSWDFLEDEDFADVSPDVRRILRDMDRALHPLRAYGAGRAREVLANPAEPPWRHELAREALRDFEASRARRRREARGGASPDGTAEPRKGKVPQRRIIGSKGKTKAPGDER